MRYSLRRPEPKPIDPAAPLNHNPTLIDAPELPKGYKRHVLRARIGTGADWFGRARAALLDRAMYDLSWVEIDGAPPPFEPGQGLTIVSRLGPVWSAAPVRVLAVEDGQRSASVTIGAIEGHPVRGVERFGVELDLTKGAVLFTIDAVSQPVGLARIGKPVVRFIQRRFRHRAADAMAAASRPPKNSD